MLYAYQCPEHGEFSEEHDVGTAPNPTRCPTCGALVHRLWTTAIHFGYGFNPYGDRVQKSREMQERFYPGRG